MGRRRQFANATERQRAHRQKQRALLQSTCVHIGDLVTLYLGDARGIAPTLQGIDALITDPPYGVAYDFTKPRRSYYALQPSSPAVRWSANILGDDVPFDPTPWLTYPQVIVWGGNYSVDHHPPHGKMLIWDKRAGSSSDN